MTRQFYFIIIFANFVGFNWCDACDLAVRSKYRSIDGSCNNLKYPNWGKSLTAYGRLLPAAYSDGIYMPRKSVTGDRLPDARLLSRTFFPNGEAEDNTFTLLAMQFGQFVAHDMSHSQVKSIDSVNPTCCNEDMTQTRFFETYTGVPCMALTIQPYDPMFRQYGQRCLDFSRGTTDNSTQEKAARTLTGPTHYLDLSHVYGINDQQAKALREMKGGRLRISGEEEEELPPNKKECPYKKQKVCFLTGDPRSDQTLGLASLHVIMFREHNRVARNLEDLNPHWSDEELYQEARRIVIAEYQHITYHEWITEYVGMPLAEELGIFGDISQGYSGGYDQDINPSVFTEHANGAMRAFHSNIKGKLNIYDTQMGTPITDYDINEHSFNPEILTDGRNLDDVLIGLATQPQGPTGTLHSKTVTGNLFRRGRGRRGVDLKSSDILRGRSEGIPGYNEFREFCGLPRADTFDDLREEIHQVMIEKLKKAYASPDDIDLAIGGVLENKISNSELGPTNLCIFIRQFYNTRYGDRFFYDRGYYRGAFTPAQLTEIRKASISRIICDNAGITKIQEHAFAIGGRYKISNNRVLCSQLPEINLKHWKQ